MYSVSVSSACYKEESVLKAVKFPITVAMLPGLFFFFSFKAPLGYEKSQFKHLNLFSNEEKVFILIIKISLFCILQYISNISTMKH